MRMHKRDSLKKVRVGDIVTDHKGRELQVVIPFKYFNKPCKNGCKTTRQNGSSRCVKCTDKYRRQE